MINIYVATHKAYKFPNDENYIPLHVGREKSTTALPYLGDDSGESISDLNESFCELTGLYWIWKNCNAPLVGLVHYRRYFDYHHKLTHVNYNAVATSDDFHEFDEGCDIIVPNKRVFGEDLSVKQHYARIHREKDLDVTRDIIARRCPDYLEAFDSVMVQKEMFACNMFIAKNHVMQNYSSWLFDILFLAHKEIDSSTYEDNYQKRVFGFLSERLFNVWIEKNKNEIQVSHREIVEISEKITFSKKYKFFIKKIKSLF